LLLKSVVVTEDNQGNSAIPGVDQRFETLVRNVCSVAEVRQIWKTTPSELEGVCQR